MEKFQHKLRTTLHTRSVESIMGRTHAFFERGREQRPSQPKLDNITTYLRKFQIDRENLNLAKRIMQCESEHSRNKYAKEWKKTKKFLRVRSNFKPQLTAEEPKIYKIEEISGHGRLLIRVELTAIESHMKMLSATSLYLLRFSVGGSQLIPNKEFLTLGTAPGYTCTFFAPHFLKSRPMTVRLIKVIENSLFQAGKFSIDLGHDGPQHVNILGKSGQLYGNISVQVSAEVLEKEKGRGEGWIEGDRESGWGLGPLGKQNQSVA